MTVDNHVYSFCNHWSPNYWPASFLPSSSEGSWTFPMLSSLRESTEVCITPSHNSLSGKTVAFKCERWRLLRSFVSWGFSGLKYPCPTLKEDECTFPIQCWSVTSLFVMCITLCIQMKHWSEGSEYHQDIPGHKKVMVGQEAAPVRGFTMPHDPKTVNGIYQSLTCYFLLGL